MFSLSLFSCASFRQTFSSVFPYTFFLSRIKLTYNRHSAINGFYGLREVKEVDDDDAGTSLKGLKPSVYISTAAELKFFSILRVRAEEYNSFNGSTSR